MIYLRCNAEKCYWKTGMSKQRDKSRRYDEVQSGIRCKVQAGIVAAQFIAQSINGYYCRDRAEIATVWCGILKKRLSLVIAASYETAIILAMFRQHIVAENFMLRAMRLMRMQSARR